MSSSDLTPIDILHKIVNLNEDIFRNVLCNFFLDKGHLAIHSHGNIERGSDIILRVKEEEDILKIGQYLFFQVKKGNITTAIWRKSLHSQLLELYDRSANTSIPIVDDISCRILLVTNGEIKPSVIDIIRAFNRRHYLPIEMLDGRNVAALIHGEGCTLEDIEKYKKSPFKLTGNRK